MIHFSHYPSCILPQEHEKDNHASEDIIYSKIYLIRKNKVMLGFRLASLYNVEPKVLNQSVKRNIERFPSDFMFQLTAKEWHSLRSQIVTLDGRGKYPKYLPFVFTEQGVSMLSSVLNSPRAIAVNIQIMRIFVRMRKMISGYKALLKKIQELEKTQHTSNKNIASIYEIIKELLDPSIENRPVGFRIQSEKKQA